MSEESQDQSSKTEDPTEKRLAEARKKGDVPSSRETATMTGVFALFLITTFMGPAILPPMASALSGVIDLAGQIEIGSGRAGVVDVTTIGLGLVGTVAPYLGMLAVTMIVAAILGVLIQGETVVSLERIKPKLSHLSMGAGFKRVYGTQALVEFLKNLVKLSIVCVIALIVARRAIEGLLPGSLVLPEALPELLRREAAWMLMGVSAFLVPIAIADILWKRFQWLKKHRMSQKDLKDEHKEAEGSPEIKRRRAELRDAQSKNKVQTKVPGAAVVLTNPTHYAVALRYDRAHDPAPVCVAKGVDMMAAQIRQIARDHDVTVIENRALARALYAGTELDQVIPSEHWQAVAQIIAYVLDLKARLQCLPPPGSRLRDED